MNVNTRDAPHRTSKIIAIGTYGEHTQTYVDGLIIKQFVVLVRKIAHLYEPPVAKPNELRALA